MPIKYNYEVSVSDNKAKLNKDIFLFRGNRNIHYYFSIKGARFTFSKENENLLESSNAIYAAITVIKPNGVEVANAIAPVEDGLIHLKVTEDLIDEEVEVGDFDLVFDLFDDNEGAVTIPKIKGQFHVQERPCTTSIGTLSGNVNVVNQAVVDLAIATQENEQLIVVDDDGKYVKTTWVKGDKISVERLNKIEEGIEKNSTQYKDITNKIESGNIGNNVEPELMDMPRIYFSEGTLPTTKTATMMKFDYYSKTTEYHGWAEIKCQGNSSMSYPKKNFTIKLYKDKAKTTKLKIDFKGWGKQSKFVLKANWIDLTHARNVVSARIWGDIVKSRADYSNLPELLRTSPNQGAIDGFPVTVYGNGYYQGRYTLNIPKDKWMSNMDDTLDTHCILCGENYGSGCFRALPVINGSDWTDELHDTVPATIKTSWTNAIKFVMNSSDSEFKANLSNYFDVNSLIDYLLYGIVSTGFDAFGKNQIYMTYDGTKWIASMYDMDSTWGLWWNGSSFVSNSYSREQFEDFNGSDREGNLLYIRLQRLFISQLKARYTELRQNIFTYPYLVNKFEEFVQICPQDVVKEDYASTTVNNAYTGIPSKTTNNIQQLRNNINARLIYVDGYISGLAEDKPCTAISLNTNNLTFTSTDTQTLITALTPADTTDTVSWSVNPTGICTVEDGVVTPTANGNCVITAKCGEQTATCNVTVSGITTQYTITNNLTNCATSNTATSVEKNSKYLATITPNSGCTLDNVRVTMGGTDITNTSVSNGVITINSVTGNIIITANATKEIINEVKNGYLYADLNPDWAWKVHSKTSNTIGNNSYKGFECGDFFNNLFAFSTDLTDTGAVVNNEIATKNDTDKITCDNECISSARNITKNYFGIKLLSKKCTDLDTFKTYIKNNPINVGFKLVEGYKSFTITSDKINNPQITTSITGFTSFNFAMSIPADLVSPSSYMQHFSSFGIITGTGFYIESFSGNAIRFEQDGSFTIKISQDLLTSQDADGLIAYLNENPITIYYI